MQPDHETLRPEELLAQLGWVRALARSLVSDPELTDEVLQDVCLLALQKTPPGARTGPRLRAWLATATRLLARRAGRSEFRRARREQAVARPEALPSAGEVSAQREALRLLVEAVTSLEEPYFSSVVERYFDGRSVAEIAARHATTAAAIRQRLSRAKAQLRARFGRLLGDERVCRLLGVLPAVSTGAALTTPGAVAGHAGKAVVAKHVGSGGTLKFAAALVLGCGLILVTWWVLPAGRGAESTGTVIKGVAAPTDAPVLPGVRLPVPAASAPVALLAETGDTPPSPSALSPSAEAAPAPAPPETFRIVVVDAQAVPVPDAVVETVVGAGQASMEGFSYAGPIRESVARTLTDALGRCTVTVTDHPGDGIVAWKEGVGASGVFALQRLASRRHGDGSTVIALVPRIAVRGHVVRADGAPVAGCSVVARQTGVFMEHGEPRDEPAMITDGDGRFEGAIDYSPQYQLVAVSRDGSGTSRVVNRKPGEPIELTLRMPGDWWIAGVVLDEASRPVAGANVLALHVPDDADAEAIRGLLTTSTMDYREAGKAGADGSFAISVTEAGAYAVTAFTRQRPAAAPVRTTITGSSSRADVTLRLPAPAEVSGVVLDETGVPVPRALVTLQAVPPTLLGGQAFLVETLLTTSSVKADQEGRFRFASLPPDGVFDLRACPAVPPERAFLGTPTAPCEAPWTRTVSGDTGVVLTAEVRDRPRGSIRATIVSAATGEPVPKANWSLAPESDSRTIMAVFMHEVQNADGVLEIPDLDPGATYTLAVSVKGYGIVDVHDIAPSPEGTAVAIALPQLASLQIEVVDDRGAAVPYAHVEIHRSVEFHRQFLAGGLQPQAADEQGRARFDALDPGTYSIHVAARGIAIEESVDVGDGAAASRRVALTPR